MRPYLAQEKSEDPLPVDLVDEPGHHDHEAEEHVGYGQGGDEVVAGPPQVGVKQHAEHDHQVAQHRQQDDHDQQEDLEETITHLLVDGGGGIRV